MDSVSDWTATIDELTAAEPLEPADLEQLATALFMVGREDDYIAALERAFEAYERRSEGLRAARCAFWIGMEFFMGGEISRGSGWFARAHRLLDADGGDCAERGYLLLPEMYRLKFGGDMDGAIAAAGEAAAIGRRFGEPDLTALATQARGVFLIEAGRQREGLALLDEAMLSVIAGELSPMPTGIVYCSCIEGCRVVFEPRRAQEWTDALHLWCESQPDLLAFTGDCHLHRGELMELHGAWEDALGALDRAAARATRAGNARVLAHAAYLRGQILRLQGDLAGAERAFREAARGGYEPQPGLALLRLAQGDVGAACGAIRRVLEETSDPAARAVLLAACVEILLAAGDVDAASEACGELAAIAEQSVSDQLAALAAQGRGAVELARGDAGAALPHLRAARTGWRDLGAPYEAARVQLLIARACSALGDEDSAAIDREAAMDVLAKLGAAEGRRDTHGLTERELEVLRLVAAGHTNKAIADELVLSERTVDRHVSNILAKLRVASRAAATAFAYEHGLVTRG
jgi:DNA-binding CsgD family transcriptional regulator